MKRNLVGARSSSIISIAPFQVESADGRITRLNMVDLAGSERGCTSRESLQVRRDLSNLGAVLRGVSSRTKAAIPFGESTLTWLLKVTQPLSPLIYVACKTNCVAIPFTLAPFEPF